MAQYDIQKLVSGVTSSLQFGRRAGRGLLASILLYFFSTLHAIDGTFRNL
jgi:hypothetical protein